MASKVVIHGQVAPGFEHVRDVFLANFVDRGEVGAAVSAFVHGESVVDLWAGTADVDEGRPWSEDTTAIMFSATKGLVAVAFLMLEDAGALDVDREVRWYWPEFGREGKEHITVRMLLNHRAGLPCVDEPIPIEAFEDLRAVEGALVRQRPLWPPGSAQSYAATVWGAYAAALFRRVAGESVGTFLQREVFDPLGGDLWLGTPRSEHHRVATLYPVPLSEIVRVVLPKVLRRDGSTEARVYGKVLFDKQSIPRRALTNPDMGPARMNRLNDADIRTMELPWMNAIGTARALAKVYAVLGAGGEAFGHRLVSREAIERVAPRQSWSYDDATLCKPLGYSQGFIKEEAHLLSPNEAHFGHTGAGGTVGFADPVQGLGMAYLMNRMDHHIRSPRCIALCRAVYHCLQDV